MSNLINLQPKEALKQHLLDEKIKRVTLSFYNYYSIANPQEYRNQLYKKLSEIDVLGRIYVANEGINAQLSIPEKHFQEFKDYLETIESLKKIRLNIALEDDGKSFWKLTIKVRKKIVADGIEDKDFSVENKGKYLNAEAFNQLTNKPETVVVDMRNFYEYEVGHFENAKEIPADTFRDQLPMAAELLKNNKKDPIVMYCTGGIRCEKASAYLLYKGFKNVYHLEGGIIEYVRTVKEKNLDNKFRGKNFVFDARMGERITDDVLSNCHQCGESSDSHRNCKNLGCHMLFIQCEKCNAQFDGCCSKKCKEIFHLPEDKQKEIRREIAKEIENSCTTQKRRRSRLDKKISGHF